MVDQNNERSAGSALEEYIKSIPKIMYGALFSKDRSEEYSVEAERAVLNAYQKAIGLDIHLSADFDHYLKKRNDTFAHLPAEIQAQLKDTAIIEKTKKEFTDIDKLIAQIGKDYKPDDLRDVMHEQKAKAIAAIQEQQKQDLTKLESLNDSETIETLKKHQEQELKQFQETINNNINYMHRAAAAGSARIFLLSKLLHGDDKKLQAEVMELIRMAHPEKYAPGKTAIVSISEKITEMQGVNPNDIKFINALCGTKFNQTPSGGYTTNIPCAFWCSSFHAKANFKAIALTIRGCGYQSITMFANHSDEQYARQLGRAAYIASREIGFPASKIAIEVNGKTTSASDLFSQEELQNIEDIAQKNDNIRGSVAPTSTIDVLKTALKTITTPNNSNAETVNNQNNITTTNISR